MIILAGDIDTGINGVNWMIEESERLGKPVVYVLGNHEFYNQEYFSIKQEIRTTCNGTEVQLLDCDVYELNNVRILGLTLWTDYLAD